MLPIVLSPPPDMFVPLPRPNHRWHLDETTSTDANQFKASGYLDTGKLGQAVSMYGNAAGTAGSTLTFNRGAQISGNNYEHINTNQGTITFHFKPSWAGTDGAVHYLFSNKVDATHYLIIYKSTTNNQIVATLYDGTNNPSAVYSATTISSGTFYNVIVRWSVNKVDGTNYLDVRVNNGTAGVSATTYVGFVPAAQSFIGSDSTGATQAQSLIDDVAIYDRVLAAAEMTSINVPNEAGFVADSSLKFYAKMDGTGTLSPVTYNGGAAVNDRAYNSSTNVNGDLVTNGNMEAATTGAPTSWTAVSAPTLADAEAASILQDIRSQKITVTGSAQGIKQALTVTAASNWSIDGWLKSDGTNTAQIRIRDATNGTDLATLPVTAATWTKVNAAFKAPAGCTSIEIYVESGTAASYSFYTDNVSVHKNLVDNGGMEGTYSGSGTLSFAPGWANQVLVDGTDTAAAETTIIHSGVESQKVVVAAVASRGIQSSATVVVGNWYLISAWLYVTSGSAKILTQGAIIKSPIGTTSAASWTRISYIGQATTTTLYVYATTNGVAGTFYVDDISVTPLDNVALSLKAWAPVTDSSAIGSSLSVQGSSTGVQSLASGIRNSAYTFDGSTGYLRQQTIAVNVGTLAYLGNDTTTAQFEDDGLDFSTYQTTSGNAAYMIVVTNSDNTTSWGYLGTASGTGNKDITIYTTKARATRGWNGTAPVAGSKVPVGYEVRKTDFQITGNLTVGAWVNSSSGNNGAVIVKYDGGVALNYVLVKVGNDYRFYSGSAGSAANAAIASGVFSSGNWTYLVGVWDGTNAKIYVNGNFVANAATPIAPTDNYLPLLIGTYGSTNYFPGSIDEPFVTAEALTATQIMAMFKARQ